MRPDDYRSEMDKLIDIDNKKALHERDQQALEDIDIGMPVSGQPLEGDEIEGVVADINPERGTVFVENYGRGANVPARRIEYPGKPEPDDISDLEDMFGSLDAKDLDPGHY